MYVLDDVLLPRIALPCNETRAWFDVAVRARTLRDAAVVRDVVVFARARTLRDVFVVAVAREFATVPRDETPRAILAFELVVVVVALLPRFTTFALARREFVALRGDCAFATPTVFAGAIGSANTARIDTNVEQTKNAPASKNTVPTAFLQKSVILRLVINTLLLSGNARKTRCLTERTPNGIRLYCCNYNIFAWGCKY